LIILGEVIIVKLFASFTGKCAAVWLSNGINATGIMNLIGVLMQSGNEVAEMSVIVKKEWRLYSGKVPGTHQWVLRTVLESFGTIFTILLLAIIATFIVVSNISSERGTFIILIIFILGLSHYVITRLRYIMRQVQRYRKNQQQINAEIEFQFDNMMRKKYNWYNLSHREP